VHDDLQTIRDKVTDKLLALEATLQPILPALLVLLDVPVEDPQWQALDPPQRRHRLMDAIKHLLLREIQVQPLFLIVENLHWIDGETQMFLDGFVESLPAARVLLLVSYRPEFQHGWTSKSYYTQLRLDPLPPASAQALAHSILGHDTSVMALTRRLIELTEGNPLFLEESIQTLVETQALTGERGAYRLAKALPHLQVPATVHMVLAARIDRLPVERKRLLQIAAVIGKDVPFNLLQAIVELPAEALLQGLAELQRAEFLYERSLFPELAYTFKHALTHEVAYGSLRQEQRKALHARIVEALEALYADRLAEQVERLAHHALRGEVWDKALAYCRQAGEKAMVRSAHREAVGYFEQALSALPHLPETRDRREQAIDLRLALRSALQPSGDSERILAYLREAESLAAALDDPRQLAQVLLFLSLHFSFRGVYDQAMGFAQRALVLATASGEVVLHALANLYLGNIYKQQGNYHRAIDYYRQTSASLDGARRHERFGLPLIPAVNARSNLAQCHAELGTFVEGSAFGDEGLRIAEAVEQPISLLFASWGVGLLALRQGNLPRALPLLERAVRLCQDADLPRWFPMTAAALGAAYVLAGRVTDAVLLLTQVMEQATISDMGNWQAALCSLSLGEAYMLTGRLEEAHVLAEGALAHACAHQEWGQKAYALRLLSEIAAHREPPNAEEAETYYRQALALAEALGMRPLQAHCHLGLGLLYTKMGRREQARTELSTAIELYRVMEMTFWLSQAEATLAQVG
jgi:tetratricopeptide (TPR) repeat protein